MLAARLQAAGEPLVLEELTLPAPSGSQVRLRVAGCGVCHTDLHIARGEMRRVELPRTLGHEISGWIEAWGPEANRALRDLHLGADEPVLVFGGWGCGACTECRAGDEQRCTQGRSPGFQEDGGYAEAVLVPHPRHLVALGDIDPVHAAPLADAGLTPYRAIRRAAPWLVADARVLLIGFGGLGQFALQYLRRIPGLRTVVVDTNPDKAMLAGTMGADGWASGDDWHHILGELGGQASVVLDLVGSDETLALAAQVVAAGGLTMLVGEAGGHLPFGFDGPAVESWLSTSAWGSLHELREVVALAGDGSLDWEVETAPLESVNNALARLAEGRVRGRLVLVPGDGERLRN